MSLYLWQCSYKAIHSVFFMSVQAKEKSAPTTESDGGASDSDRPAVKKTTSKSHSKKLSAQKPVPELPSVVPSAKKRKVFISYVTLRPICLLPDTNHSHPF